MSKINIAQMKSALSAVRDARREYANASMAGLPPHTRLPHSERFRLKKISTLLEQDKNEVQRISKGYNQKS
jgi:hypothetical protein